MTTPPVAVVLVSPRGLVRFVAEFAAVPPPPKHQKPASSRALSFIDRARIDALLEPFVSDAADRAFVLRCILEEGPLHHRGSNYVLLALLAQILDSLPGPPPLPGEFHPPMRLPPHLEDEAEEANFPLALPTRALARVAGDSLEHTNAMVDALTDGPPQHALANVAITALLQLILDRLEAKA